VETVFGKHSVRAVLIARPGSVRRMILAGKETYHRDLVELAREHGIEPVWLSWPEFLKEGGFDEDEKHQGVAVFADRRPVFGEADLNRLAGARLVLGLDQISDPQNLGTILRVAAFFHADAVLLLKNRSAEVSPLVARVAVGGAELVDVFQLTNLARGLEILKELGFWIYGLDERGEQALAAADLDDRAVLVVGAEGEGLRRRTRETCDLLVRIPGGRPGLESLNAGVAAAIALYELVRTRG
jgi:23S rRNA (guanosine2251-2'-O)-methyltransferase